MGKLICFLGELAKHSLRWPKHHSNTATLVMLDLESMQSRLLMAKLGFLRRRMVDDEGIGAEIMCAVVDDVELLCLVKECCELERVSQMTYLVVQIKTLCIWRVRANTHSSALLQMSSTLAF